MPVIKEHEKPKPCNNEVKDIVKKQENANSKLFAGLDNDDIILLIVFFILIMDNCEDRLLLLALAFVFFSDYFS